MTVHSGGVHLGEKEKQTPFYSFLWGGLSSLYWGYDLGNPCTRNGTPLIPGLGHSLPCKMAGCRRQTLAWRFPVPFSLVKTKLTRHSVLPQSCTTKRCCSLDAFPQPYQVTRRPCIPLPPSMPSCCACSSGCTARMGTFKINRSTMLTFGMPSNEAIEMRKR
jgi:hypothetical protein